MATRLRLVAAPVAGVALFVSWACSSTGRTVVSCSDGVQNQGEIRVDCGGPCPACLCGSRGLLPCPLGTFCDWPLANPCGLADVPGVCSPIPASCTGSPNPVCGCDNKTYSNACYAAIAGVSVFHVNASPVTCDCQLVDPACGTGSCQGTSYCEGSGCATPVCYPSWSPVSQLMCGGQVAQPQIRISPLTAKVLTDADPVGTYNNGDDGSDRGSGFSQTATMLRHCDKLFVTWQQYDRTTTRFTVFVGTNQLGTNSWSTPTPLPAPDSNSIFYPALYSYHASPGGMDDHGGASIVADGNGYLHVLYGAHNSAMLEAVSTQPWDASAFSTPMVVPTKPWYETTYSSAVRDSTGTIHVVFRGHQGADFALVYMRRSASGMWDMPQTLAHINPTNYGLFDGAIAVGADDSLHVAYQMYTSTPPAGSTIPDIASAWGYLRSSDYGAHWEDGINAGTVALPVDLSVSNSVHFLQDPNSFNVRVGNIALDAAGNPWVTVTYLTTSSPADTQKPLETRLWHRSNGAWSSSPQMALTQYMPAGLRASGATLTFDSQGILYVAAESVDPMGTVPDSWQYDPSKEVVLLVSADLGATFQVYPISQSDPSRPRWLANLERPTTGSPIPVPALLYTDGNGNASGVAADVVFVPLYKQ